MKSFILSALYLGTAIVGLRAQAPVNPESGNHSLTQVLLGNIPSHSPVGHDEARYRNGREFEAMMS